MKKIILDTNVIFSAILFDKKVEEVFLKVLENKDNFEVYRSLEITKELELKLKSSKFLNYRKFDLKQVEQILEEYYKQTHFIQNIKKNKIKTSRDLDDNKFLDLATQIEANFLITGDKDLLVLKKIGKTIISTPAEFSKKVNHL